jgi:hypothetical protein
LAVIDAFQREWCRPQHQRRLRLQRARGEQPGGHDTHGHALLDTDAAEAHALVG